MVLALMLAAVLSGPTPLDDVTSLGIGSQRVFSVTNVKWFGVGDPSVIDVKLIGPNQVLAVATARGSTRLVIGRTTGQVLTYSIKVRAGWKGCGESELAHLMGWSFDEFNARAELVGSRIIVRGPLESLDELRRLAYARSLDSDLVVLGHLDPEVVEDALRTANLELMRRGYAARAIVAAGQLFIEGNVEDYADALKVEAIVAPVRELLDADRAARGEES